MNNLYNEYIKLEPNIKVLYISPSIHDSSNEYLTLLYKDIINLTECKSLRTRDYPLLVLKKLKGEKSIVHHHWFGAASIGNSLGLIWKLFWLFTYRIMGGKIIWTIHNKYPHDQKLISFNKIARILMGHTSSKLHVHCEKAIEIMSKVLKVNKSHFFIVKHPDYPSVIFSKEKAIEEFKNKYPFLSLDFEKKTFLVFGQMAQYKGIEELLELISTIKEKDFNLILAGKVRDGNSEYVNRIKEFKKNEKIIFLDEFIPDDFIPVLFNLSDCVLFNYNEILTSGAVILSLNYKKYTIAPNKACISNIDDENLITFNTPIEFINLIKETINNGK